MLTLLTRVKMIATIVHCFCGCFPVRIDLILSALSMLLIKFQFYCYIATSLEKGIDKLKIASVGLIRFNTISVEKFS